MCLHMYDLSGNEQIIYEENEQTAIWTIQNIRVASRIVLITAVVNAMPIYHSEVFFYITSSST